MGTYNCYCCLQHLTFCQLTGYFFCMIFVVFKYFPNSSFSKYSFRNTLRGTFSLIADQDRRFVGLVLVQFVCKSFQQTAQVGEELECGHSQSSNIYDRGCVSSPLPRSLKTESSSLAGVTALWSLSKTHLSKLSTGSIQEDPSLFN